MRDDPRYDHDLLARGVGDERRDQLAVEERDPAVAAVRVGAEEEDSHGFSLGEAKGHGIED
jgi:hypothetical protein